MAWSNTDDDKLRHLLRLNVGPTMRLSQVLSLAPYPLSVLQTNCSVTSVKVKVVIFIRLLLAIGVTFTTVASLFVLFFYYPELLYNPTVPIFIKILYYIGNTLQIVTVANLLIGCEKRRLQYERYFDQILVLVRNTASQSDCQQTIWYRNTTKALLVIFCSTALLLPVGFGSVMLDIGVIPYMVAQIVPFIVSTLILLQYYSVFVHLASILRKLNERIEPLTGEKSTAYVLHGKDYSLHALTMGETYFQLIEHLRLLHLQTMDIAGVLSENIALIIVLIVVATFASVNIELLELYQSIKYGTLSPFHIILKAFYAGTKFFFYVLIAYPNWLIQIENQRTIVMLYKIKRASCSDDTNGAIEHYVSQISNMQGVHEACGMVNLDMKLISGFGRWSFLVVGVAYGAYHQNRLAKREVGIREIEAQQKVIRDAKLAEEKKRNQEAEAKAIAELSAPTKK
ncbi:AGAP006877-PB-like protein [Anopheles sinensis]|uniref:Gustatory receptor n=1 Tax=Anopheles sinensis TaxID=74873 RepID=A0A084W694_ANOSI|nr:AGAP006877-PB-like protein [Anopheles sinensis]